MTFHKVLLKLHLWTGLASSIFLLILGVTGSILEWEPEVNRMEIGRQTITVEPRGQALTMPELLASLQKAAPGAQLQSVSFGLQPSEPYRFGVFERTAGKRAVRAYVMNQYTGEVLRNQNPVARETWLGRFMGGTRSLHRNLWAGRNGTTLVNYANVVGIFLIVSGIYLWWPRKIWWTTKGASWRRFNFDLHSVVGLYTMVFFFIIAFTGSMIHWGQIGQWMIKTAHQEMPRLAQVRSSPPEAGARPLPLDQLLAKAETLPGDKTTNLNFGQRPADPVTVFRFDSATGSRILCSIDQYTGAPLVVDNPATRPWMVRIVRSVVSIHEGNYFGWTGRIIACITSTAVPVMVITGFIIWWKRKLTEWRRRWAARSGARLTPEDLEDEVEDEREDLDRVPQPAGD